MFKEELELVPTKPGSYQMYDKNDIVIYVGKAKNLKRRLSSYFNRTQTGKTAELVKNIAYFKYIVTNTELESFILEINLIKKYNPKYNILLKDDKTYPYIELTNEKYPRVKIIRTKTRKKTKSKLFGPFPNVVSARKTVDLINRIYPLRKCNTLKKDLCLYYHINECLGYCKYNISKEQIDLMIKEITEVLNGNYKEITKKLEEEMFKESENLNYEKALELKKMIEDVKTTISKQIVVSNVKYNFDVFGYYVKDNYLSIETLFIREGIIIGRVHKIFDITDEINDVYLRYITNFYEKYELPKEIIIQDENDISLLSTYLNTKVNCPKKGDVKHILDMAINNAEIYLNENLEIVKKDLKIKKEVLEKLKSLLNLTSLKRIDLFDNSHLFGTYYVGCMVVYEDLEPNKNFKWIADMANNNPNEKFVIAGSINEKIFAEGIGFRCPDNMKLIGYVSDEEGKTLMRDCKVFLFPSIYEGFGMPPLEAMSAGAKHIVVSDIPVMHEIFGNSVDYIGQRANSVDNINKKSILNLYSWDKSAKILLDALINKFVYM